MTQYIQLTTNVLIADDTISQTNNKFY